MPNLVTEYLVVPPGLPAWITAEAIGRTIQRLSPLYGHEITVDEAVGILINMGNTFSVLKGGERVEVEEPEGCEESGKERPKTIRRSRTCQQP